ncbi:MAG: hypothetical protein CM15mP77_1250 [Synechococcus sp.]|nr:MAG: hypothetical protein CM15mP77_1250 [Synechococcus sp.]
MGAEVIKAVVGATDCTLVGAVDNTPGKEGAISDSSWDWANWRWRSRQISKAVSVL